MSSNPANKAIEAQLAELRRKEELEGRSGAVPFTPKQKVLDATDLETKNPGKRYRWVNVGGDGMKASSRQQEGYTRVPEAEGGKQVGNLALFETSQENYQRRVADTKKRTAERLTQHNREVENAAETIAKHIRDTRGVSIRPEDIIVRG